MTADDGAAAAPAPAPTRPAIVCPDSGPEAPHPLRMEGEVISGFGRGSKELGIPTANLPVDEASTPWIADAPSGVYFGYASLCLDPSHPDYDLSSSSPTTTTTTAGQEQEQQPQEERQKQQQQQQQDRWHVYPMVMSIGYNPFYGNAARSAEVHALHAFGADFYGRPLRLLILGFVRPERGDYASLQALVDDIGTDCAVARRSLRRPAWTPAPPVAVIDRERSPPPGGKEEVVAEEGTLDARWLVR